MLNALLAHPLFAMCRLSTALIITLLLQACGSSDIGDAYDVETADGVTLKLVHYRPSPQADYHQSQPIVLFPGLIANMNEFLARTPVGLEDYFADMELPADAPRWALEDRWIEDDPMRYYSIAHWLYAAGYDVWLANYRGVGREEFASDPGLNNTNLDVWMTLDTPAIIETVADLTGRKPVIGGHSTGGLVSYLYLQGFTMDANVVRSGTALPHVHSDPILAAQRNSAVAGFLGIDPAGIPPLAFETLLNTPLLWSILGQDWYVDLDSEVAEVIIPSMSPEFVNGSVSTLFNSISNSARLTAPEDLFGLGSVFDALDFWHVDNMNQYTQYYFLREALSGFYLGVLGQYTDWGIHQALREHWQNGQENTRLISPPAPERGTDGYAYYDTFMNRMTVPALSFFSEYDALVATDAMVSLLYGGKTAHPMDTWYEIKDSAHIDIVINEDAPRLVFPRIIEWLDQL